MLNINTEKSFRKTNLFLLLKQIRLKQLKSLKPEKEKSLPKSKDVDVNKPLYEIQINNITHDISNSVQYIMESAKKFESENNLTIYKIEFGVKTVFFKN